MANPYLGLPPGRAGARLAQAQMAWWLEVQQWQVAAWHHVSLLFLHRFEPGRPASLPPQPATVAGRMASRSMRVIAGGRA